MKEFFKWLGVNEKVAKVAVWMLIIMVFLIVTNSMLGSIGFPNYQITAENLERQNTTKVLEYVMSWTMTLINFYAIIFLVFRLKEFKNIFKYSILYLILNILCNLISNYGISQIFIMGFIVLFCYFYSKKNWKYVLYGIGSLIANTLIQFVWFSIKASAIDYTAVNQAEKMILTIDYFIIMAIIILVKEIILKKRSERECHHAGSGSEHSTKKTNLQKK